MLLLCLESFLWMMVSWTLTHFLATACFLICQLLSFPISFLYHVIDGAKAWHWFSIIVGAMLQFTCYRHNMVHFFGMLFITKILMHTLPRAKVAKYVFWYCLTHLSLVHIYICIVYYGFWGADLTAYLMISTCNLSSLAYCYADGDPKLKGKLKP